LNKLVARECCQCRLRPRGRGLKKLVARECCQCGLDDVDPEVAD